MIAHSVFWFFAQDGDLIEDRLLKRDFAEATGFDKVCSSPNISLSDTLGFENIAIQYLFHSLDSMFPFVLCRCLPPSRRSTCRCCQRCCRSKTLALRVAPSTRIWSIRTRAICSRTRGRPPRRNSASSATRFGNSDEDDGEDGAHSLLRAGFIVSPIPKKKYPMRSIMQCEAWFVMPQKCVRATIL